MQDEIKRIHGSFILFAFELQRSIHSLVWTRQGSKGELRQAVKRPSLTHSFTQPGTNAFTHACTNTRELTHIQRHAQRERKRERGRERESCEENGPLLPEKEEERKESAKATRRGRKNLLDSACTIETKEKNHAHRLRTG